MAMPRWAKILIILVVLLVLAVGGVIGAGAFWWMRNKDALMARGKAVIEEGTEAGRKTDNQGCVDLSVTRYKTEPGIPNGISTSIFMQSCLEASKPTPGFCDDVPEPTEFIKTGQWQLQECQNVGLGEDQYCRNLFQAKQRFCVKKNAKSGGAA
jgi:hypothetical protein